MKYLFLTILLLPFSLFAQIQVASKKPPGHDSFAIIQSKSEATIVYDSTDFKVVHKSAGLLASDIEMVTNIKPMLLTADSHLKGNIIIVGTIGKNQLIDKLIAKNKINVESIEGEWERFLIQTVKNPFKGIDKALVIAGSDKRGAAYGVFTLSEKIGVSPWYYWADVPVKKRNVLYVNGGLLISKAPSVKYRGIFLNDEDWGLHPWAAKNIDPDLGDIGPNTYEKVFELLLRLKGNMVAPAMHECTKAFFTVPGNMEMAADYGIMMTTSHCEPLLYNNASEWDVETQGEWNYAINKDEIVNVLEKRVKQAHEQENIYTIALRGISDDGMKGGTDEEKLKMLAEAIKDQRGLLEKYIDQPLEEIPQIFVPYKEVLGLYEKGLEVPEEITIVWPDDNYGYIKKLSNKEEQKRKGGAGVYYHISYLGWPNDYLWLNTTPPALMYAEMHKAWSLGAKKYWLLNVGDIKPGESAMQLFLDMAWDFEQFNFENINQHQVQFLTTIFGEKYKRELTYILDRYYYHGFTRKPEYMTWDWRWNSIYEFENVKDTDFSFVNYREAERRLKDYNEIADMAGTILNELPGEKKAPFFELVYYPVKGASLYNHEMLTGQKNRWYASQNRVLTNQLAKNVKLYHDSLAELTATYNNLLNGKWNGMMTAPGFLPEEQLSPTKTIELKSISEMGVFVEGQAADAVSNLSLPAFNAAFDQIYFIDVYNKGLIPFMFEATANKPWIKLSKSKGKVETQQRIEVSLDWEKFSDDDSVHGMIVVSDGQKEFEIKVSAIQLEISEDDIFIENNGVISIAPTEYHRKTENGDIVFQTIEGLGYANAALQMGNAKYDTGHGSFVEYDFYVSEPGELTIHTYMLPLFAKDKVHSTQYGIQVDEMQMITQHNDVKEYTMEWAGNVIRNSAINKSTFTIEKPGKHSLKVYCVDPGMIIQKILIDTGGLKDSYMGPEVSKLDRKFYHLNRNFTQ